MSIYIGLLTAEGTEPAPATGYSRVEGDLSQTVAFPPSLGYGEVSQVAVFDAAEGGAPIEYIALPEPVDCHEGVIPIIHKGRLLRGIDVVAKALSGSGSLCRV